MEKIFEQVLLYDFYGELLTEHQRSIYEDAVCNDMSLGEIAEERGISRQGVHDLIKRCDRILLDYESKLHLVERFGRAKEKIGEIVALTGGMDLEEDSGTVREDSDISGAESRNRALIQNMQYIRELAEQLMQEL